MSCPLVSAAVGAAVVVGMTAVVCFAIWKMFEKYDIDSDVYGEEEE